MTDNSRQYSKRFIIGMIAYVVIIPISLILLNQLSEMPMPIRLVIALLPVLPAIFMMWAMVDYVRGLDELQQRIQLEAFSWSLGATAIVTFTLGFAENAGISSVGLLWVFPMMIVFWGIGQVIARRRY